MGRRPFPPGEQRRGSGMEGEGMGRMPDSFRMGTQLYNRKRELISNFQVSTMKVVWGVRKRSPNLSEFVAVQSSPMSNWCGLDPRDLR